MLNFSEIFFFIIAILVLISIYYKVTTVVCKSNEKLDGKTAVVTGGTSGMGLEIAKDFARRGARVIIACPFDEEGEYAREEIVQQTGSNKVIFKKLDLGSFKSVRDFAANILKSENRLDILMNNAGIIFDYVGERPSVDGLNRVMQVNYYGHFLLTLLLLPLLKRSAPSRIVNMCSHLHRIGKIDLDHMNDIHQSPIQVYGNSKLCLVFYARELAMRLKGSGVTINNADPGAVGTPLCHAIVGQFVKYLVNVFCRNVLKSPFEGAQTAIHMALDEDLEQMSGEYFVNSVKSKASQSCCEKDMKLVWEDSVRVCKLSDDELEQCLK